MKKDIFKGWGRLKIMYFSLKRFTALIASKIIVN